MEFDLEMKEACDGACPPDEAEEVECTIFRAVETNPATEKDFSSWVKLELKSAKKNRCEHWGLSVWTELDAVNHARDVIPRMQELHIAAGDIEKQDGVIKATPTTNQPKHFTYWSYVGVDLLPKFTVIIPPVAEVA
ncbi:hypothetical protein [Rhizobium lentis]|uniref:hypothetical protein n=1 Tax=Rhizobium lentis TaxID=1138194 RepID=UPI001C83AEA7|nr:hypothetical protein [Rhizobium lentis]MBX5008124.1 hypothetical protein [Rhizobium lentis]